MTTKACCFFKLVAIADLMGCMACFLHWKVAGQMLPMGPQIFPSRLVPWQLWVSINMIIKRQNIHEFIYLIEILPVALWYTPYIWLWPILRVLL